MYDAITDTCVRYMHDTSHTGLALIIKKIYYAIHTIYHTALHKTRAINSKLHSFVYVAVREPTTTQFYNSLFNSLLPAGSSFCPSRGPI